MAVALENAVGGEPGQKVLRIDVEVIIMDFGRQAEDLFDEIREPADNPGLLPVEGDPDPFLVNGAVSVERTQEVSDIERQKLRLVHLLRVRLRALIDPGQWGDRSLGMGP